MTDKPPLQAIRELVTKKLVAGDLKTLSDSADLLGGLSDIMQDPALRTALDGMAPEQVQTLQNAITQAEEMEALTAQMVEAEDAGDEDRMQVLLEQFQSLSGMQDYVPEKLPAPYEAIRDAIEEGDLAALQEALAGSPDLNVHLGRFNSFPLCWAALSVENNRLKLLRCLLEHGADASFATPDGYAALHFLMDGPDRVDTVEMIDALLQAGAALEAQNHYGWTPLLVAVMEGTPLVMQTLLERGANVHARFGSASMPVFSRGCTAMMVAGYEPEKVRVLLQHGADPAGSHDDGRGFNAYADDVVTKGDTDRAYIDLIEESRSLINAARLN